ncbi:MAG TPA: hypothetical protein VN238_08785 [Solirubrobacteraceae bacterium]|nr:hypothetical protein [Solirubrobacteraceae bacterium]
MTRWLSLMLLVIACALGLTACGGDDSSSGSDDPAAVLKETFGAGKVIKSGELGVSLRLNTKGLANVSGPLALKLTGPFQSRGGTELPKFDFTAQLDLSGQSLRVGAVSTDDKGFITVADQAYEMSADLYKQFRDGYAEQAKCSDDKDSGVSLATLGIDPSKWLSDAKSAGEEEVGGAETTHVTAGIAVPAFLEDVNRILGRTDTSATQDPCADDAASSEQGDAAENSGSRQLSESDRKAIAEGVKSAKVDVWTGKDDRTLRRLNIKVAFDVPEDQRKGLNGLSSGDITFDLTFAKLNEDQTIAAPKNAKPLTDLQGALGGITGGGGASGSGSGTATTPTTPATPPASGDTGASGGSAYDQCVQAAGTDIGKLQECAQLIGQ